MTLTNKDQIQETINKGLIIEDEFVALYGRLFNDESFYKILPAEQKAQIERFLKILLNDSMKHHQYLTKILKKQ